MTAKRRVRKQKKATRRNTDVNPHPFLHEVPAPERRSESRRNHPAGRSLKGIEISEARIHSVSFVGEGEGFPGSEVRVLDVASLYPAEIEVDYTARDIELIQDHFRTRYEDIEAAHKAVGEVFDEYRERARVALLKLQINAEQGCDHFPGEEGVCASAAPESASAPAARGSEGSEGLPAAEQEAEPQRRQASTYAQQKALRERWLRGNLGKEHVVGGVIHTSEEELARLQEKPGPEPHHFDYGRQAVSEARGSGASVVTDSRPTTKTHLNHFEREVNLVPVHVGSSTCHCSIGKDHWTELGEN